MTRSFYMIFISTVYSLYSYFISPYFFIDKYSLLCQIKPTSFLIFTPFPTFLHLSKPTIQSSSKNVSEDEIKRFVERIKKHSFNPFIPNIFEEL